MENEKRQIMDSTAHQLSRIIKSIDPEDFKRAHSLLAFLCRSLSNRVHASKGDNPQWEQLNEATRVLDLRIENPEQ